MMRNYKAYIWALSTDIEGIDLGPTDVRAAAANLDPD